MANKKFTPGEMEYLRGSEYVLDVTESCVYFSAAYKAEFYQKLLTGKKAKDIFAESGIVQMSLVQTESTGFAPWCCERQKAEKAFVASLHTRSSTGTTRLRRMCGSSILSRNWHIRIRR